MVSGFISGRGASEVIGNALLSVVFGKMHETDELRPTECDALDALAAS
jgi:hypothetical protein